MNRREKLLGFGFAAAILLWQGTTLLNWLVFEPLDRRNNQIETLEADISTKKIETEKQRRAIKKLAVWKSRSLPPDPVKAGTEYKEWLIEQAGKAKLTEVKVDVKKSAYRPEADLTYYRIEASVEAQGSLDKVCDFLHAMQQSYLLHHVKKLTLETSKHGPNPPLEKFVVVIEALALRDAPSRNTLLADPAHPPQPEKPLKERKDYAAITDRNLFVKTFNGPKKPARPNPTPADDLDQAELIFLVGVRSRSKGNQVELLEGILYDRTTNKEIDLTPGSAFTVAGLSGKTVGIGERYVILEIEGTKWRLDLGENLRQMKKAGERETALPSGVGSGEPPG